ncbi:BRD4-interacting chromatin-remodeling complex-associated protein-like [Anoplopoma fimbria]|uniref:BRD4-interacting chromatin-remodeling complex-associated protein-like n=1 Tax=Anoplopoma fimbria TaxID=229290 RepID=UPI0023ED7E35|nr:BRD4-interacting chromatin-remodeling complex-associated protein-like [Anoplopoma fimbria]XP_054454840.1 BRD4-interacting chromatin-remodeling complex-associated protein-like [Anoplopoma fimbria]
MDDEDDRHLLDILGDVDALNDYLHGSNSKSIEEDDVTNAAFGSDGSFFSSDTVGSNSGLKDGSSTMGEFGDDSTGAGLQLSSSLSFIEDELGSENSPGVGDLGGEDQPFDILQKSLMEADITEQTLAQEALLDSQPAPTLVQAPVPFSSQLVSGGYGGGVVTTATAAFPTGQFLQGVSQLPNGSAQHIQVLGSFGAGAGVMTLSSLERTPQLVLRQGAPVAGTGATAGGQVFAPTQGQVGQVGLPFKNIPLQNIIIQRGPGGTQTLVRPIQPKPLHAGGQTVYSLGLHPTPTTMANVANANTASPGGHYTANGSIVVQPPLEQQQAQSQTNIAPGQYLLPSSLALTSTNAIHNGPADHNSNSLITSQNAVQIVAGQNFTAPPGGQLILNQGVVSRSQVGGAVTQTWTGVPCANSAPVQTSCAPGRLTLVGPATAGIGGQGQMSACPVQRLLVTQTQNCNSLSPLAGTVTQEQDYRQNSSSPALKQVQLSNIHAMNQDSKLNSQVSAQKRPALPPLTRGEMILLQLRKDHAGVHSPDQRRFNSIDDALQRLLPYHVFQGTPPSQEEFSQVDDEFEVVATQVLMRTHVMVNKYRRLLMVEAERSSPSSEMVMIDRTFNQEERSNLTQDKRMILVDPDTFFEDFCCGMKSKLSQDPVPSQSPSSCSWNQSDSGSAEPPYRTDSKPGFGDPGGGGAAGPGAAERLHPPLLENKSVLELKRSQQHYGPGSTGNNSLPAANSCPQGNPSPFAATARGQTHHQVSPHLSSPHPAPVPRSAQLPPHGDTDSALEAAVNSILEC